jgi:hypothetical protein
MAKKPLKIMEYGKIITKRLNNFYFYYNYLNLFFNYL